MKFTNAIVVDGSKFPAQCERRVFDETTMRGKMVLEVQKFYPGKQIVVYIKPSARGLEILQYEDFERDYPHLAERAQRSLGPS